MFSFRFKNNISVRDFNRKFQDADAVHNKRLSKSLYMSFNRRLTLRNYAVCYISSYVDFRNFIKANLRCTNMNLLITDRDLFWYARLKDELEQFGYAMTIVRDTQPMDLRQLEMPKQAVFLQCAHDDILGALYAQWINQIKARNQSLSVPLLFVPDVAIPNMSTQMLYLSKFNVHLTLYGGDITTFKRWYPKDYEMVLAQCDTLIVSKMTNPETAQYVQHRADIAYDLSRAKFAESRNTKIYNAYNAFDADTGQAYRLSIKDKQCIVLVTAMLPVIDEKL